MEHVTAVSRLHAQQGIRPSIVIKFHQISTSGVGRVAFMRIWDGWTHVGAGEMGGATLYARHGVTIS